MIYKDRKNKNGNLMSWIPAFAGMTMNYFFIFLFFWFSIFLFFSFSVSFAQDISSGQQINDFSLSGYGDKGKKVWDLAGKTADVLENNVKLQEVVGNLYSEQENVKLTADKGDFNKAEGKVHLEEDVVITTASGSKLTTDSLDWDRKNNLVSTKDKVNIEKGNMVTTASGATGHPGLNKVNLEKDVKMEILSGADKLKNPAEKIVITCDGSLEIDYEKNIATFTDNVKVDRVDSQIYSDKMDVYFNRASSSTAKAEDLSGGKIDKIVAHGNVKIVKGENISYSDEAVYNTVDRKIVLSGKPKLVFYSGSGGSDAPFGN